MSLSLIRERIATAMKRLDTLRQKEAVMIEEAKKAPPCAHQCQCGAAPGYVPSTPTYSSTNTVFG